MTRLVVHADDVGMCHGANSAFGVHLTLNAEKADYRWRPVSGVGKSSGLVDSDGCVWHRVADTRANAHPDALETEWRAQIDTALADVDDADFDAHMGAALGPEWCDRYIQVGVDDDIPVLITRALFELTTMRELRAEYRAAPRR